MNENNRSVGKVKKIMTPPIIFKIFLGLDFDFFFDTDITIKVWKCEVKTILFVI